MHEELLKRIDEYVEKARAEKRQPASRRAASKAAGLGPDYVRDLSRQKVVKVSVTAAYALEDALHAPRAYFLEAIADDPEAPLSLTGWDEEVPLLGQVQAGVWKDAPARPPGTGRKLMFPPDPRYPPGKRYALKVCGDSMDRIYPNGTTVLVIPFGEIARMPRTGDKVVVQRRSASNEYEATLKEYEIDASGRHILWPRSSNPEFQQPIILSDPDNLALDESMLPAGAPGLMVVGLVVGSFRLE